MNCPAVLTIKDRSINCDWPKEHSEHWAHVNEDSQILWGDNGISYKAKHVCYWLSLPDEMQPLVHVPHMNSIISRA